jgi:dimethylhistidine N-methyltransferase
LPHQDLGRGVGHHGQAEVGGQDVAGVLGNCAQPGAAFAGGLGHPEQEPGAFAVAHQQPRLVDDDQLPPAAGHGRRVGFFPGSTLGNFTPDESLQFLQRAARLLRGGALLLGADLVKDPAVLHAAYNDSQGVTAAFNLNLLARANRELGAGFVPEQFAHSAFYNAPLQRIEMHLVSRRAQAVTLGGERFQFEEGETLHTENSYKFTLPGLRRLAERAGFRAGPAWTDPQRYFCVQWLQAP